MVKWNYDGGSSLQICFLRVDVKVDDEYFAEVVLEIKRHCLRARDGDCYSIRARVVVMVSIPNTRSNFSALRYRSLSGYIGAAFTI